MEAIAAFAKNLYSTTGLNFSFIYDPFDRARWIVGIKTTILLSIASIFFSMIIGLIGTLLDRSRFRVVRTAIRGYVHVFRNTPPLAQLYFFYFALAPLMPYYVTAQGARQPYFDGFLWAVIALSLLQGAYTLEIFRSGLDAVPKDFVEASNALALGRVTRFCRIEFPLAVRICLPAMESNLVNSVKNTSMAYAIAVPEILYQATQIWGDRVNVPEVMCALLASYMVLVGAVSLFMRFLARRLAMPGYGT